MTTDLASYPTSAISWTPPPGMTFDEYVDIGRTIAQVTRACQFILGDWVNHGEHVYGHKYDQIADVTGYDGGTLRNFASVAGQIEPSRRRDDLPFGHHQAVTSIKDVRLQDELLARAAAEHYPLEKMRAEARSVRLALDPPAPPADPEPEPQWSEPPGHERAVEGMHQSLRTLAAITEADREITAVWVRRGDDVETYITIDGVKR